jgi:hypothetical protein
MPSGKFQPPRDSPRRGKGPCIKLKKTVKIRVPKPIIEGTTMKALIISEEASAKFHFCNRGF